ncbi:MAG: response regulator [Rhodospirillales bacterium]|nr:response regulator [Rhodospirillales bacterium]
MAEHAGHILVAHDNTLELDLLSRHLEQAGYTVKTSPNGQGVLTAIEEQAFDAVVLEMMMPEIDGFDILHQIRMHHPANRLPVILITAKTDSEAIVAAFKVGANDYVRKPIDLRVLQARLSAHIGRKAMQDELIRTNQALEERVRERTGLLESKEAHLRALLETIPNAIISIGTDGLIRSMNQNAEKMFGILEQDAIGLNISNFMDSPHAEYHDTYLRNYIETGQGAGIIGNSPRQVPAKRSGGKVFPAELSVGELKTEDEHLFVGVLRDVSDRVEIESQLRQFQKMEAVGRLTGGVAHDFNNLLTVIMGNLQLLERTLQSDEKSLFRLNKVMSAAKSGADLTRRLLTFSRQQVLEIQAVDINEVVREMEQMLFRTMGEDILISTSLSQTPCIGRTDQNQLENALLNLCINARDAMPDGGRLTLETQCRHLDQAYAYRHLELQPGDYVEIAVTDTGMGIPADIKEHIFEPFFTTKHSGKGTGLGLSTIFGFMKQSGGHVNVYSEPGLGSTFKLLVPAAHPATDQPSSQKSDAEPKTIAATVLVVEDDDGVRELAVSVLRGAGFTVIEAVTGVEGLKAFQTHPEIDMVFSDVIMPGGMSGPEMVEKIFEVRPDIPVLFASGYAEQALKNRETLLEHAAFLAKPYFASELPMRIRRMMEKSDDK